MFKTSSETEIMTYIILIANVYIGDFHLKVFDHLSDQLLHKGVLLFSLWIL